MITNNIRLLKNLLLLAALLTLGACATKVERISPDQVRDLSGNSLSPLRSSSGLHTRRIERLRELHFHGMICIFCL